MTVKILIGNCRVVLKTLEAESVHSVVTDPPYELAFMGKSWDNTGVAFDTATWAEVLRVMKPGAYLLAFGGTRTHHRMMCAIEDAGFELRDVLGWLYGSGFPKSKNLDGDWKGWGSALKPAWEPIIMARKPFKGSIADNVQAHGVGAINIDGCRIHTSEELREGAGGLLSHQRDGKEYPNSREGEASADKRYANNGGTNFAPNPGRRSNETEGRWPANILHDGSDEVLSIFPREAGAQAPVTGNEPTANGFSGAVEYSGMIGRVPGAFHGDTGSAARFFYCPKVSTAEREVGTAGMSQREAGVKNDSGRGFSETDPHRKIMRANHHPTVKPVDLMRYLIRLVTPPGGTVLDCFAGSGSTLRAADIEGFSAIGIEVDPEYAAIAKSRVNGDMPLFAAAH